MMVESIEIKHGPVKLEKGDRLTFNFPKLVWNDDVTPYKHEATGAYVEKADGSVEVYPNWPLS